MRKHHMFDYLDEHDRDQTAIMYLWNGWLLYAEYYNGKEWADIDPSQLTDDDIAKGWREGVVGWKYEIKQAL